MKTIQINVYHFNELSDEVKKNLQEKYKEECLEFYSQADWNDFNESLKYFEVLCDCKFTIDESSQGFSVKARDLKWDKYPEYNDANDEKRFQRMLRKLGNYQHRIWTDDLFLEAITNHKYYNYYHGPANFGDNVSDIVKEVCNEIYYNTFNYFKDDIVSSFISESDTWFFENGDICNSKFIQQ